METEGPLDFFCLFLRGLRADSVDIQVLNPF